MMGRENPPQASLFYMGINLERRVRSDHVLRKVARLVDFEFIYGEVKESYGYNGNVSVPPPMILKADAVVGALQCEERARVDGHVTRATRLAVVFRIGFGLRDTGPQRGEQSEETLGSGIVSKLF